MSKNTAFGGNSHYQDFKSEGKRVIVEDDSESLIKWLEQLKSDEPILVQQAAAVCYSIGDMAPHLFKPHQKSLIEVLKNDIHPSGPRFIYRLLTSIKIEKVHQGEIIDLAFKALAKPTSPVAIQVFAMTVIANHIPLYPGLAIELEATLATSYSKGTPGYKSRAKKIARAHGLRLVEKP